MDGIYVVTVEASPIPGYERFFEFGVAYINVYTTSKTEADAIAVATVEVREASWQLDTIDDVNFATCGDFDDLESGLEYFEQALIDGVVVVVYTFPPDTGDQVVGH